MKFQEFVIQYKRKALTDTYIFRMVQKNNLGLFQFTAGQYCFIANPLYKNPFELHPFSIASDPLEKNYLEFCIKIYGSWTQAFSQKKIGDTVFVSNPQGKFIWNDSTTHAVFLLGGIGISPIISMLRFIANKKKKPYAIILLYGNRTPNTIAYKKELETLATKLPLKISHIFSELSENTHWNGYKGFITKEIIKNEANLAENPTFFIVGPPIFIKKMHKALRDLKIPLPHIKQEILDIQSVPSNQKNTQNSIIATLSKSLHTF